jgi:hypothetical protein
MVTFAARRFVVDAATALAVTACGAVVLAHQRLSPHCRNQANRAHSEQQSPAQQTGASQSRWPARRNHSGRSTMTGTRTAVVLATAVSSFYALAGVAAMPTAHATPIDNLRGAVNDARARSSCAPMNYSGQLEGFAQHFVRGGDPSLDTGYAGEITRLIRKDDPTDKATEEMLSDGGYNIANCAYKDFGVGMVRYADISVVGVELGIPAAPAAPPAPPAPAPANTPAPPPAETPPQVFTNAITPSFDTSQETVFSITLNNSSPLPASCNYEAKSLNPLAPSDTKRTFNVAANGSDTETFNGLKTLTQYKITVNCADSSGKQTQPLGSVNQTVTW